MTYGCNINLRRRNKTEGRQKHHSALAIGDVKINKKNKIIKKQTLFKKQAANCIKRAAIDNLDAHEEEKTEKKQSDKNCFNLVQLEQFQLDFENT